MAGHDANSVGRRDEWRGERSAQAAANQWGDVPAESAKSGATGPGACRNGIGGFGVAWLCHMRFIRSITADADAPFAAAESIAAGGKMELLPNDASFLARRAQ